MLSIFVSILKQRIKFNLHYEIPERGNVLQEQRLDVKMNLMGLTLVLRLEVVQPGLLFPFRAWRILTNCICSRQAVEVQQYRILGAVRRLFRVVNLVMNIFVQMVQHRHATVLM